MTNYLQPDSTLQVGKYKIIRFINSGGFGCTYEGIHVLMKKHVAIKEFFVKDYCNRDEATAHISVGVTAKTALVEKLKRKFIEEAQAVSTFNHPNIVKVHDVFEENGTAYYVMDYVEGPSLNEMIKQQGKLPEAKAVKYIRQVADALRFVHKQNRLHLDVKPGNIMVGKDDNAVLIDFGTSKQYDEVAGENTSTLMGMTPGFAPLEQMGNDVTEFTPSTDIYALGATLYKLLTGITPPASNHLASGKKLQPLPSSVSQNVRNAILKAMLSDKYQRPQSIDEFLQLMDAPVEKPVIPKPVVPKKDDDETVRVGSRNNEGVKKTEPVKPKKSNTTIIILLCVVALLIVGGVIGYQSMNKKDEPLSVPADIVDTLSNVQNQQPDRVENKVFKAANGNDFTYTGSVADGKPNGQGTGIYPLGTYTGEYKDGMRQGEGKFVLKNGSNTFEGTFVDDQYSEGRLTMSDGFYFVGKFKDGQPYNGKWYDKNGKFDGDVVNGQ